MSGQELKNNYILRFLSRDSQWTLLIGILAVALGLVPWVATSLPSETTVICRWLSAIAIPSGIFALSISSHAFAPMREPGVQALARYGSIADVLQQLQSEYESSQKFGRICLGANWLTFRGASLVVVRLDDLAGVEVAETRRLADGVQVRSDWRLLLYTLDGLRQEIACPSQGVALGLVPILNLRSPWSQVGPEAHLGERWANDREGLLAEVRESREQLKPLFQKTVTSSQT